MRVKTVGRILLVLLAAYGAAHLASVATDAGRAWPQTPARPKVRAPLTARQQPLVSALSRVLQEDGVRDPARWASAIVRSSPTTDLGYLALVTAQIRRESRFLAPDLEWLYQRVVPELVHDLGVDDPIRTIGPMQVQRWRLHDHFEQALGARLDRRNVAALSLDVETGVAACVAVLDEIVVAYVPDRRLTGHVHSPGPTGLLVDAAGRAVDFVAPDPALRTEALRQKLLSDLTGEALALDGVAGARTTELLARFPEFAELPALRAAWQQRYRVAPPNGIAPRITHDPRLAFVLADFHSGAGSSRLAALQALTNALFGTALAPDGKWGPLTKAEMPRLIGAAVDDAGQRADFVRLLENGHKRGWLRAQLLQMARSLYAERFGRAAPDALVPELWFDNATTRLKGLGRISVAGYVAGSAAFYEDYLRRLCAYAGVEPPGLAEAR
ncbi:MAG: hypothetical protein KAI24_12860 [Planctomycetes bacterium]|nr:hypothetical protein [Planctomycetota bacterium]